MLVEFYTRAGCHLCDDVRAALEDERARSPFELREIDIESSDALVAAYGLRIPVVVIEGEEAFEYVVDPEELRARLGG
jgi:glutaredoxin